MSKILFVGPYPPPYGGIASHLKDLLPSLLLEGYDAVTLTWSDGYKRQEDMGVENIYLSPTEYFSQHKIEILFLALKSVGYLKYFNFFELIKLVSKALIIRDHIKSENVSSLIIYDNSNGMVIPILRKQLKLKCKLAFMVFGDYYLKQESYKKKIRYIDEVVNGSDFILASSQHCADSFVNIFQMQVSVEVIYVGVDEHLYSPAISGALIRAELAIPESSMVILFLGRMVHQMGLDFLIDNIPSILDLDEHIYFIVAGADGELGKEIEKIAKENIRVKYCPDISFDKKAQFYRASDIMVAPSMENHACMGVSIKEAMSCAIPVVASTSGGIPEAIEDGLNGYLIPIESGKLVKEVFITKIFELVENNQLRNRMGQAGRKKVISTFSNQQTLSSYLRLLKKMGE